MDKQLTTEIEVCFIFRKPDICIMYAGALRNSVRASQAQQKTLPFEYFLPRYYLTRSSIIVIQPIEMSRQIL